MDSFSDFDLNYKNINYAQLLKPRNLLVLESGKNIILSYAKKLTRVG